ncbi:MAG: integrase arm-type DNA-binding domain-containing protein [Alphaproteobacteria bacterium]|nr:integrase arm-type DNA-binding domain-containing protein [Alphaproteobacteria bacterium]
MLTDTQIRNTKAGAKPFKLYDTAGLFIQVAPSGSKLWRLKYRFQGKEKLLSLGKYPAVTLSDARRQRDAAKADLADGNDPAIKKKLAKQIRSTQVENTFEAVALEWYELQKTQWVDRHAADVLASLQKEAFPYLGNMPIADIKAPDVLACVRIVEKRPAVETARRLRQRISAVFEYAIATARADTDPAAIIRKAMAPLKKGRQPAIINLADLVDMLRKVDAEPAHPVTKLAIRIIALTAVRPGTLATTPWAEWADIAESKTWRISAARMKMKLENKEDEQRDHILPLADATIEAIEALRIVSGRGPLAFPNARHAHKPMSENAMGYLINRAGYHQKHVPHGFRAAFSSIMNEARPADRFVIDRMLAHISKDKTEAAYNRASHLEKQRDIAEQWAAMIAGDLVPAAQLLEGPRR